MTLFYHYSHEMLQVLVPTIGRARHKGEDPRAVDKPVVWLNDRELDDCADSEGPLEFLHIVEIDERDPDLFADSDFDHLMHQAAEDLGVIPLRWFFYLRSLPVKAVRTWNGTEYC